MEILSIRHKALRQFVETGRAKGLDARLTERLRAMIAYLAAVEDIGEFYVPPNFGFHLLSGNRAGTAALTVTKNWRMTFRLNDDKQIIDLDLEDYH
jgi:proteic killer suppression protein